MNEREPQRIVGLISILLETVGKMRDHKVLKIANPQIRGT